MDGHDGALRREEPAVAAAQDHVPAPARPRVAHKANPRRPRRVVLGDLLEVGLSGQVFRRIFVVELVGVVGLVSM